MNMDNVMNIIQPQSITFDIVMIIRRYTEEFFENAAQIRRRYPNAIICHGQEHHSSLPPNPHRDHRGLLTIFQCIVQQIGDHATQMRPVPPYVKSPFHPTRRAIGLAPRLPRRRSVVVVTKSDEGRFADAEALYSYEGTYQIQNLILGKAITGLSAFT